ncbi:MAG: RluA family pseudouridine synthase [Bacteroidales bacterium]
MQIDKKGQISLPGLKIIYEDDDLIVIDKEAGLLSVGTTKTKSWTAHTILNNYVNQDTRLDKASRARHYISKNYDSRADDQYEISPIYEEGNTPNKKVSYDSSRRRNASSRREQSQSPRVFIVHRLDRDTSGLMLFAKNDKVKTAFQERWKDYVYDRRYMALIAGTGADHNLDASKLEEGYEGEINAPLGENSACKVFVPEGKKGGDLIYTRNGKIPIRDAVTRYRIEKVYPAPEGQEVGGYALASFSLDTGRKNQIRAHMEYVGYPIIGDKKYGSVAPNPYHRLCLHAYRLCFIHPLTKEKLEFESKVDFKNKKKR